MAASCPAFYREPDFETLQVHAGYTVDPTTKSVAVPIYQSTAWDFGTVDRANRLFTNQELGHIYSRVSNPTVDVLEKRVAALEGGVAAVATSSGQAAQMLTVTTLARAGDNIVSSARLYGGTYTQFKVAFDRLAISTTFVETTDPAHFAAAINGKTKLIFLEIIANSDGMLYDIEAIAKIAHDAGIPLVVDNTLGMGGYLIRPISLGADIVVHSATKWLCGHGTTLAGVIVDSGKFDWRNSDKFPSVNGPSPAYGCINFAEVTYPAGFATVARFEGLRDLGPCLSAQSAFSVLQGIETLSLRAQRQCDNALALAKWLEAHPKVQSVNYLGLPTHPSHALALKVLRPGAFGGVITFRVAGGFEKLRAVIDNLKLASHHVNFGDARTLVVAPHMSVQAQLTAEEKAKSGVFEDTIRFSLGIESAADIIADVEGAFGVAFAE